MIGSFVLFLRRWAAVENRQDSPKSSQPARATVTRATVINNNEQTNTVQITATQDESVNRCISGGRRSLEGLWIYHVLFRWRAGDSQLTRTETSGIFQDIQRFLPTRTGVPAGILRLQHRLPCGKISVHLREGRSKGQHNGDTKTHVEPHL